MPAKLPLAAGFSRLTLCLLITFVAVGAAIGWRKFDIRRAEQFADLVATLEREEDQLRAQVEALVLRDFRERLAPGSSWDLELQRTPGALAILGQRHLGQLLERIDGGAHWARFACRVDLPSMTADEQDVSLCEALPSVRVVDLVLTLSVRLSDWEVQRCLQVEQRGGRLDGEVEDLVRSRFEAADDQLIVARLD